MQHFPENDFSKFEFLRDEDTESPKTEKRRIVLLRDEKTVELGVRNFLDGLDLRVRAVLEQHLQGLELPGERGVVERRLAGGVLHVRVGLVVQE